ncbi:hypothetical protein PUMCH_005141 [Australozyma saopauloensis]|uniref:Protein YIP n=1 Tax=Australozyma saopauloensis TaxID=291208 RepID=A0AAX4HGI9_9ASCO|nr:hypothetical protein PUMCH_005141 [[Candida] saopauloensis]
MFQVGFYSRYFDINTEEFLGKIVLALNPLNHSSAMAAQDEHAETELYGFLWINATLVFLMFVSSTGSNLLALWLHSDETDARYEYNFKLLTLSITLFYGYTALVPAAFYALTAYYVELKERLSMTRLISIYSYANVLWIPSTVANIVLAVFVSRKTHQTVLTVLQWLFVAASAVLSGLSIVWKVRPIIQENLANGNEEQAKKAKVLVGVLIAVHFIFAVVIKVCFFGIA